MKAISSTAYITGKDSSFLKIWKETPMAQRMTLPLSLEIGILALGKIMYLMEKGEYENWDGTKYKGEYKNGRLEGKGQSENPDGRQVRLGILLKERSKVFGEFFWTDGSKYVGEYFDGLRHGHGDYGRS